MAEYSNVASQILNSFSYLALDRWVGLEGLMSVVAYPDKGANLFRQALFEKRDVHIGDLYTITISNRDKQDLNFYESMKTYPSASMPGVMAFLLHRNPYFLFFGMIFMVFVMMLLEYLVMFMTKNPYFDMTWSAILAFSVSGFGLAVYASTIYYLCCLFSIFCLWVIQEISSKKDPRKIA